MRRATSQIVLLLMSGCTRPSAPGAPAARDPIGVTAGADAGDSGDIRGSDTGDPGPCTVFPADNPWNQDVRDLAVHEWSTTWIDSIGANTPLLPYFGIDRGVPVNLVTPDTPLRTVDVTFEENSDAGSYPLGDDFDFEVAEGLHNQHRLVAFDPDACQLYELFDGARSDDGSWAATQALRFDLNTNELHETGWNSSTASDPEGPIHDGSGLPLYPGMVLYDAAASGVIEHALRFRVQRSRRAYVTPATWAASHLNSRELPPMGARFRLRPTVDCSVMPTQAATVCIALQTHGMLMGENGDDFSLEGEMDSRWDPEALVALATLTAGDFEALETGEIHAY